MLAHKKSRMERFGIFCVYYVGVLAEEGEEIGRDG